MLHIEIEGIQYPLLEPLTPHKELIERRIAETDFERNVFLMMKYRPYNEALSKHIIEHFKKHKLNCIRADMASWNITGDVNNPLAVLYCCKYGVALFDNPEDKQHFGPNVAYELALMHSQWKKCLILLHSSIKDTKPFDIITKLHSVYNKDLEVGDSIKFWVDSNNLKLKRRAKANPATTKSELPKAKDKDFKFLKCETNVLVLNQAGDCMITEKCSVRAKKNMTLSHSVELFSFDTPMEWDKLNLKGISNGSVVPADLTKDLPTAKTFILKVPVTRDRDCDFEYSYYWNGMFPKSTEAYTLAMHADRCVFRLTYPADMGKISQKVIDTLAKAEVKPSDASHDFSPEENLRSFEAGFDKKFKGKRIRTEWTWKSNAGNSVR